MNTLKKHTGSVLLESMIAVSLVTVGLIGILSFLSSSIKTSKEISQRFTAAYLAAEGIEGVKYRIESDRKERKAFGETAVCVLDTCDVSISSSGVFISANPNEEGGSILNSTGDFFSSGASSGFARRIQVTKEGDSSIHVVSAVKWGASGVDLSTPWDNFKKNRKTIVVEDRFFDWFPVASSSEITP